MRFYFFIRVKNVSVRDFVTFFRNFKSGQIVAVIVIAAAVVVVVDKLSGRSGMMM